MSKDSQRYEIYINGKQLILIPEQLLEEATSTEDTLIIPYQGQQKTLFQYMDLLENSNRFKDIYLYAADVKRMFKDLKELLLNIPAAGGIIENQKQEVLMIFRRGMWDLPKGKLKFDESFEDAAERECREEVGLNELKLIKKVANTFHFFRDKKQTRCLKKTKWFHFQDNSGHPIIPQAEEDIEQASWFPMEDALSLHPIHPNIFRLLHDFEQQNNQRVNS